MRDTFKFLGFCTLAAIIFTAELWGIIHAMLWLMPFESWWKFPAFLFLLIMAIAAGFFLLWVLSAVFWESKAWLKKCQPTKK